MINNVRMCTKEETKCMINNVRMCTKEETNRFFRLRSLRYDSLEFFLAQVPINKNNLLFGPKQQNKR